MFSDTHKDFLTHGYSGRHTEKERDLEARYRHKETERPALTQEETRTQSDLHTPIETDSYRKKGKQRCRKTPLYTKTEHRKGVSRRKQSKRAASI